MPRRYIQPSKTKKNSYSNLMSVLIHLPDYSVQSLRQAIKKSKHISPFYKMKGYNILNTYYHADNFVQKVVNKYIQKNGFYLISNPLEGYNRLLATLSVVPPVLATTYKTIQRAPRSSNTVIRKVIQQSLYNQAMRYVRQRPRSITKGVIMATGLASFVLSLSNHIDYLAKYFVSRHSRNPDVDAEIKQKADAIFYKKWQFIGAKARYMARKYAAAYSVAKQELDSQKNLQIHSCPQMHQLFK
jgi:hypothetical protein